MGTYSLLANRAPVRPSSWAVACLVVALATGARAQQSAVQRLQLLAARDQTRELADAVRAHPDDARELMRRLLIQASLSRAAKADSTLEVARRVGASYAIVWADSFQLAQVTRFSRMSRAARAAKIAADSARWSGNAAFRRGGAEPALPLWREALRRARRLDDTIGIAAALGNIGAGFHRLGELDSATAYLERSRRLAESVGDRRTALNAVGILGSVASDAGDQQQAQALYSRALELRARIGDMRGAAADHNNLGLLSAELGDLADARAHYREALTLARRHEQWEPEAAALLNIANAASMDGDFAEAQARYGEALAIYRSAGSEPDAALVLHNLGLLALRRGDYVTARTRLREALAIFERSGTAEDLVQVRRDLASVAAAMGDLNSALAELRRAEQLLARVPAQDELAAGIALSRADLAVHLNTFAEAERQYGRAEALYRRAEDVVGQAEAQQGRALVLVQRRQFADAIELLQAAARTQAAAGDRRPAALTSLVIAHAQHRQGDLASAKRTLQHAVDSLRVLGDVVGEAAALSGLGEVELESGSTLGAEALYREGLARLRGRAVPTVSWQLHAGLGQALRARGALAEAASSLQAAVSDIEWMAATLTLEERRATFFGDKWEVYASLALVQRARSDPAAAFVANERMRSRQMLDLLSRGRLATPAVRDASRVESEQDLRRQIGDLTHRLEQEESGGDRLRGPDLARKSSSLTRNALARAQEQYAQLLLELRESDAAYVPVIRGHTSSWKDVAQQLQPGEALLEYLVADSSTLVFVVTPDTLRVVDLNIGRATLESLVDFVRGTLVPPRPATGTPAQAPWRTPLRRLHQHLIAPLEAEGVLAGVSLLIIAPHAELHYLPFAALIRRGERDEYLVERYEISYTPSASVWLRLGERPRARGEGLLALAPRAQTLPGSRAEVEGIRRLYGRDATILTNGAASESAFRSDAKRYGIVHLATFGLLNKHNPLFSFVQLGAGRGNDGRLEVHEIFGLTLSARLLVLSACQTALASGSVSDVPAGDDWVGMVQAFLGVGADNVIATLWPVEDRSTGRFMEQLHRGLRSGRSETSALATAQREVLRNPATASPFYWAGVVLVGGR